MVDALDRWTDLCRVSQRDSAGALRLSETARAADPDPWRNRLRALMEGSTEKDPEKSLRELAASARIDELPPASIQLLGTALLSAGDAPRAETVLRQGQRKYPGDVGLNYNLAECLDRLSRRDEAIRFYTAAKSLRPSQRMLSDTPWRRMGKQSRPPVYSRI